MNIKFENGSEINCIPITGQNIRGKRADLTPYIDPVEHNQCVAIIQTDLLYLLTLAYGYIDDELGGMGQDTTDTKRIKSIMSTYNISKKEILQD